MQNLRELKVWQNGRELVKEIYKISSGFPKEEKYSMVSQMRRSAVSIPSNIAEGAGRFSDKEFVNFLNISQGSSYELETQIFLSRDLEFIGLEVYESLINKIQEQQKMTAGLISSIRSTK